MHTSYVQLAKGRSQSLSTLAEAFDLPSSLGVMSRSSSLSKIGSRLAAPSRLIRLTATMRRYQCGTRQELTSCSLCRKESTSENGGAEAFCRRVADRD